MTPSAEPAATGARRPRSPHAAADPVEGDARSGSSSTRCPTARGSSPCTSPARGRWRRHDRAVRMGVGRRARRRPALGVVRRDARGARDAGRRARRRRPRVRALAGRDGRRGHLALEGGLRRADARLARLPDRGGCRRPSTLSVALRHTDDPAAVLAGGGSEHAVGAPGSFVAERVADPALGLHDYRCPRTTPTAYTETARLLDASADPADGCGARAVRRTRRRRHPSRSTEYGAERP